MATLGQFNTLKIDSTAEYGVYLDGNNLGNILLPSKFVPESYHIGDEIKVFVYLDKNDSPVATTQTPKISLGEVAHLKVNDVNKTGAFFDWGLPKDLLVPYAEQSYRLVPGLYYSIYMYQDKASQRLVGTTKLSKHLSEFSEDFKINQEVDLFICGRSQLGYKAVINKTHLGLIHNSEVFKPIKIGEHHKGFIKEIREDKKINLCFHLPNTQHLGNLAVDILNDLKANDGVSLLTDKSPPDAIYKKWNVSKGSYKKALGSLYKQRKITISADKIELV